MNVALSPGLDFLKHVDVQLSVELGRTEMPLRQMLALGEDSVVVLDRLTDEPLDVRVNGKLIARGEVIQQGSRFGLRILEMVAENSTGLAPAMPVSGTAASDMPLPATPATPAPAAAPEATKAPASRTKPTGKAAR